MSPLENRACLLGTSWLLDNPKIHLSLSSSLYSKASIVIILLSIFKLFLCFFFLPILIVCRVIYSYLMDNRMKEKCPQGVCSGEGEYITHHTCSYGNDLDMYLATTCDCGRKFNSLRGSRIHKARWCEQHNSPTG